MILEQSMSLKNYIVSESLKTNHAERYLLYIDRYHTDVFLDLRKKLHDEWNKLVLEIQKTNPPGADALQDAQFRNPEATVSLLLSNKSERIITSRSSSAIEVSPSIKIPLVYSREERSSITKKAFSKAMDAFKKTTEDWSEIFKIEKNSRLNPWFKIDSDDNDTIRFQLIMNTENQQKYKTLYSVRLEFGKTGTKTKDFDRIYLYSHI